MGQISNVLENMNKSIVIGVKHIKDINTYQTLCTDMR